jgi:Domain of unknown function (DUF5655)
MRERIPDAGGFMVTCPQAPPMPGRQCYHCKQWIEEGEAHDCWTTTEAALTSELSEDLRDAYARLRETALSFGDQRVYASHRSIMFSRASCYFFVRPKRSFLEVCVFLGRTVKAPQVRRVDPVSRSKMVHFLRITHRDEVEAPVTDWLQEAYELSDVLAAKPAPRPKVTTASKRPRAKAATAKKLAPPARRASPAKAKKASAARKRAKRR